MAKWLFQVFVTFSALFQQVYKGGLDQEICIPEIKESLINFEYIGQLAPIILKSIDNEAVSDYALNLFIQSLDPRSIDCKTNACEIIAMILRISKTYPKGLTSILLRVLASALNCVEDISIATVPFCETVDGEEEERNLLEILSVVIVMAENSYPINPQINPMDIVGLESLYLIVIQNNHGDSALKINAATNFFNLIEKLRILKMDSLYTDLVINSSLKLFMAIAKSNELKNLFNIHLSRKPVTQIIERGLNSNNEIISGNSKEVSKLLANLW